MNTFTNLYCWLQARAAQDRGAGLAEYALLLFLIALASLAILTDLGTTISGVFTDVVAALGG